MMCQNCNTSMKLDGSLIDLNGNKVDSYICSVCGNTEYDFDNMVYASEIPIGGEEDEHISETY